MFVRDRVELAELYQPHQMREFQRDHTLGLQCRRKATGEIIDIGHVC